MKPSNVASLACGKLIAGEDIALRHARMKVSTSHGFSIESWGEFVDDSLKSDVVFGNVHGRRGFLGRILYTSPGY